MTPSTTRPRPTAQALPSPIGPSRAIQTREGVEEPTAGGFWRLPLDPLLTLAVVGLAGERQGVPPHDVVAVVERVRHPRYGKTVQRTKKLYVHDAEDTAKVGDRVRVQETRPLSKLKRGRLTDVVERAR